MPRRSTRFRRTVLAIAAACSVSASYSTARAGTFTWNNPAGGLFSSSGNWLPNTGVPGTADTALFNINGSYTVSFNTTASVAQTQMTAGTLTLNGAQNYIPGTTSTFTGSALTLNGGLTLFYSGGGTFSLGGGILMTAQNGSGLAGAIGVVGNGSNATAVITGAGTNWSASGQLYVGRGGGSGIVTFQNGATGGFSNGTVSIGDSLTPNSRGVVNVLAGSVINAGGSAQLLVGSQGVSGQTGLLNISGAGAQYVQAGTTVTTVGAASGSAGTISVASGGRFTSGTSAITVNATGRIDLNGGSFDGNGNLVLNGGTISTAGPQAQFAGGSGATTTIGIGASTPGFVTTAGGRFSTGTGAITVNPAGRIDMNGGFFDANGHMTVDGGTVNARVGIFSLAAGKNVTVTNNGTMNIDYVNLSGSTLAATAGGDFAARNVTAGTVLGDGTFAADGAGVNVSVGSVLLGNTSGAAGGGTLDVRNGALADVGTIGLYAPGAGTNRATINITSGADLVTSSLRGDLTNTSTSTSGALTVSGADSSLTVISGASNALDIRSGAGTSTITVANGANLSAPGVSLVVDPRNAIAITGGATLSVGAVTSQSGGQVQFGTGNLLITGASGCAVGSTGGLGATPTLSSGQLLAVTTTTAISPGAMLTVDGGALTTGSLQAGGTLRFLSGSVTVNGPAGMTFNSQVIPPGFVIDPAKTLNVTNTATFPAFASLAETGGTFNAGDLAYQGEYTLSGGNLTVANTATFAAGSTFAQSGGTFSTGALAFQGDYTLSAGRLNVTNLASFGPAVTLTQTGGRIVAGDFSCGGYYDLSSGNLNVTNTATIAPGGLLVQSGGQLTAAALTLQGDYQYTAGTVSVPGFVYIQPGGGLHIAKDRALTFTGDVGNYGRIELEGGLSQIGGAGANALTTGDGGLITGDGKIGKRVILQLGGELRAESGKRLVLSSILTTSNAGRFNLFGGTVECAATLDNSGNLVGHGTFFAPNVLNSGTIAFGAGSSDFFAPIQNFNKVIVSGGGMTTFYDPINNSAGSEVRVSANSTAIFFGNVNGLGAFTGSGTKYFEGGTFGGGGLMTGTGSTVVRPGATLVANAIREGSLVVEGSATILPNGTSAATSRVGALTIDTAGGATLDLNDNDLIVGGGTVKSQVEAYVKSARNNGAWDGPGITSSTARSRATTGLGLLSGAEYNSVGGAGTFSGQTYGASDTLVKYTWNGDANFDGRVTFDDYVKIDTGFNTHLTGWLNGDFNYSGAVNFDDYVLIDISFNQQNGTLSRAIEWISGDDRSGSGRTATGVDVVISHFDQFGASYGAAFLAAVPEPATLALLGVPALVGIVRPCRRVRGAKSGCV